jgi:hypothetical protein
MIQYFLFKICVYGDQSIKSSRTLLTDTFNKGDPLTFSQVVSIKAGAIEVAESMHRKCGCKGKEVFRVEVSDMEYRATHLTECIGEKCVGDCGWDEDCWHY